ncbi:MAG: hypothetical protein A2W91_01300 [Bacteroidetes bacterium GWF2_38_335]|nr:MAG: hypothetical protein A2W91_01300 [Bacteroidetes bacterium GWF2_38_335]OFY80964.1 MAG: hypothetical protein A2281_12965 [Bacteroidetes bacterium RIFOXYA12_FULL_38_20]HBS85099.1 hypothetical protein [Bacteroidales bacterium]
MAKKIIALALFFIAAVSFSQEDPFVKDLLKKGQDHFAQGEYGLAVKEFERLYKLDTVNPEYFFPLGVCYIETNRKRDLAVKLLEKAVKLESVEPEKHYYLGRAYLYIYEYSKAVECFMEYKSGAKTKEIFLNESERFIKQAYNSKEIMSQPVNVTFENLGDKVNSTLDDFNPFVPEDESYLVFASNKKYDELYGTFEVNVFVSHPEKGSWTFATSDKNVNTFDNEEPVSITPNGKKVFICNSVDGDYSDINLAEKKTRELRINEKDKELLNIINTKSRETGCCINGDGTSIFVSAESPYGKGGLDIYMIKKLPNGTWGDPENLAINTPYDDAFPNISAEGTELYFASKGHNSIGGYDLFVTYWNTTSQAWTKPLNLGYPINTSDDDKTISFPKNKRYAYVSSIRKEGFGGYDIYRLIYNDVDIERTLIKGEIRFGGPESSKSFSGESSDLVIEIYDKFGNLYGMYLPKPGTGNFVAILPPGSYTLKVEYEGFETHEEAFSIGDRNQFVNEIEKAVYLTTKN